MIKYETEVHARMMRKKSNLQWGHWNIFMLFLDKFGSRILSDTIIKILFFFKTEMPSSSLPFVRGAMQQMDSRCNWKYKAK